MAEIPLSSALKAAIRDNEIGAMYLAGVNPYLLRAHCLGLHIPENVFLDSLRAVADQVKEQHGCTRGHLRGEPHAGDAELSRRHPGR
jgi:protocatechuate 4,5-dioxygenase alpha chain